MPDYFTLSNARRFYLSRESLRQTGWERINSSFKYHFLILCEELLRAHVISLILLTFQDYREKNRRSSLFNHLSTVSEAVGALGWVSVVS